MIRATLQQLRLFEAVARNGSFTRAAEEIHLSQPAVSIQVKRLEEQIGAPLFEMIGKRLFLTDIGREMHAACTDVFARLEGLEERIDALRGEVVGPLRLGVVTTTKYFLPHYLGAFLRRYPKVEPQFKVTNRASVIQRMQENQDDLYVLSTLPEEIDIRSQPFLGDELVLFASPNHPAAQRGRLKMEDLLEERFLFREPGSGIRMALEGCLNRKGYQIAPYLELGSGEAIKQAAMAGIGIGMLSTYSLRLELDTRNLVILDVEGLPIRREWHVVHLAGKRLSLAAERFRDFLIESQGIPF